MTPQPDVVALERDEIEAIDDLFRGAPPDVSTLTGLSHTTVEGYLITATTNADVLAQNRVLGLGLEYRASDEELRAIVHALDRIGSRRYFVPVAPTLHNGDLGERVERLGLRRYNAWMRLSRELTSLPSAPPTEFEIRLIDRSEAAVFGRLVADAFGWPALDPLAAATVGRPRWQHYLAYDRDRAVAAAAMCVVGPAAWFGFAATHEGARGRGAQKALVVRRLQDAAAAGCRWVSVETAQLTPEKDAPSFRNLRRLGFEVAYERPNYLWTRASGAPVQPH
jgi:ribosomal protein S18 acetylase RimI-like enzyme